MLCFILTYNLTVGPVCYCLVAEIPSTRLRIKTDAIARSCYNVASIGAIFLVRILDRIDITETKTPTELSYPKPHSLESSRKGGFRVVCILFGQSILVVFPSAGTERPDTGRA